MNFESARTQRGLLVPITEEQHDYMLNVLPPIYARGCFAPPQRRGEPVDHTREGVTFHWAGKRGEAHFACYGTRAEAELAFSR